jgi:hypothetical protein
MLRRLAAYGCSALSFSMLAESIPIFAAMLHRHGGLGLPSAQLAVPLGLGGAWLMVSALLIYPRTQARLGNKGCAMPCRQVLCSMHGLRCQNPLLWVVQNWRGRFFEAQRYLCACMTARIGGQC